MHNLSGKTYLVIIISCITLVISGCGSRKAEGDIAPIESDAQSVVTPTISTEIKEPTPPVSPISPVSPIKEAIMSKIGNVEPIKGSEKALAATIADLSERTDIPPDEITLVSMEAIEWRDSSLGCPQEGFMYAQVITPGYLIVLEADSEQFEYHTDQQGNNVVLCEEK